LVLGTAEHADFAAKTVAVQTAASGPRTISYDQLVIATGSNTAAKDIPWKAAGTYEELLTALHDTQQRVAAAKSIIVAGAGATGVETAAELGYQYGPKSSHAAANGVKEITLLSQQPQLLGGDSVAGSAKSGLESFGVKIEADVTVTGTEEKGGKTVVSLEGGRKLTADLYMPAFGLIPNTKFVDAKYRDERGMMIVDDQFRVKGAENVWAVGDVVSKPRTAYVHLRAQVPGVAKNVEAAVKGKQGAKVGGMPFDVMIVALGPERSAGRMGFVPLPSFAGARMKSKTLFTGKIS
jgi:apoptosis-inducing factor 2